MVVSLHCGSRMISNLPTDWGTGLHCSDVLSDGLHMLVQELEQFEQRAQGMKTKAETQAKYGW